MANSSAEGCGTFNKIEAVFQNGLLRVTLPKQPGTLPRSVKVQVK